MTSSRAPDVRRCHTEIVRHHEILAGWLRGAAGDPAMFTRFADAHTPDFTLIEPGGTALTLDQVLSRVEAAHGAVPGLRILIRDVAVVAADDSTLVATYLERHDGGESRSRRVTVVFVRDATAENSLRWRHLHETWIDQH